MRTIVVMTPAPLQRALVVGGGPGGLMAAEVLATGGFGVTVVDHMPSVGRKFLLAGRSGLNLTHSEPMARMLERYGEQAGRLEPALRAFDADALRGWSAGLGEPTFIGTSGRVFPQSLRATSLLRAWLRRLGDLGVAFETKTRWVGWDDGAVVLEHGGQRRTLSPDVTVLSLGGASWPRVGSDGGWVPILRGAGVDVRDLRPANCGIEVAWSSTFADRYAGQPLKNIALSIGGVSVRGDAMITAGGMEAGPVYSLSAPIRDALDRGMAVLAVDLQPDLDEAQIVARLRRRRPKDSTSTTLKRTMGFSATTVAWLREVVPSALPTQPADLAALLKEVPVPVVSLVPVDRAISSAGGVAMDEVDDGFMLHRMPGTYVVGEMLDWEAPTGGFLLQATFATAVAAARAAVARAR
jgi:uncharacterized flavoprotein (TIGR03862 family)